LHYENKDSSQTLEKLDPDLTDLKGADPDPKYDKYFVSFNGVNHRSAKFVFLGVYYYR